MPDEPKQKLHWLTSKRKGIETVDTGWDQKLGTFFCIIAEDGASTRYGTSEEQYPTPELLFDAIRGQWAENEPDRSMVDALLRAERAGHPYKLVELNLFGDPPAQDTSWTGREAQRRGSASRGRS